MSESGDLLVPTAQGLWCPAGDFHIDPLAPVERAVITHAHGDHARSGSRRYLTSRAGKHLVRLRIGPRRLLEGIDWGERVRVGDVHVSFHPAGHVLGSAQVRIERAGEVWVVSGDYKLAPDPTCRPFEPVACDVFVTEASFADPRFRWPPADDVLARLRAWWLANRASGRASIVWSYPLGKSQRILASVAEDGEPIYVHGAVERVNEAYRRSGVVLPRTTVAKRIPRGGYRPGALVIAPPTARRTRFAARFEDAATAVCSGWAGTENLEPMRPLDLELVLSDHADWPATLEVVAASGAGRVWITHGRTAELARELRARGVEVRELPNVWDGRVATEPKDESPEEGTSEVR